MVTPFSAKKLKLITLCFLLLVVFSCILFYEINFEVKFPRDRVKKIKMNDYAVIYIEDDISENSPSSILYAVLACESILRKC